MATWNGAKTLGEDLKQFPAESVKPSAFQESLYDKGPNLYGQWIPCQKALWSRNEPKSACMKRALCKVEFVNKKTANL